MDEALKLASDLAQASGKLVHITAQPYDKGWTATCGTIEYGGGTPFQAVHSVMQEFMNRQKKQVAESEKAIKESNSKLEALKQYE